MPGEQFREKNIKFSVDLVEAAKRQLAFLARVNQYPALYSGPVVNNAIRRYEKFWLPLAAEHPGKDLAPPLDIHWVWHVHMLAPYYYEKDCQRVVNTVVNHRLMTTKEDDQAKERARSLWTAKYPGEPFEVDLKLVQNGPQENGAISEETQIHYNLRDAICRQQVFYYQVSLPHFQDKTFLKSATTRYKKYLFLKQQNTQEFLVPCYDYDLIWHAHQLHPLAYKDDTTKILGKLFNHDDSVNDREADSKLTRSQETTMQLWKNTFGEDFALCGAMFRGMPPNGRLERMTRDQIFDVCSKHYTVNFQKIDVGSGAAAPLEKFGLRLTLERNKRDRQVLVSLKSPCSSWKKSEGIYSFNFDSSFDKNIFFELIDRRGILCCRGRDVLGAYRLDALPLITSTPAQGQTINKSFMLVENAETDQETPHSVDMTATVSAPRQGPCYLYLQRGSFTQCTMPENIEQLWGPVPLARLPPGQDNVCMAASHR